jgi:hypothetical protein
VSIHLLDEEKYIEDGYIDTSYFGGLLEGQGLFTPYFEEGYIEEGYIDNAGMAFVLTADLTIAITIQQAEATLSSAFAVNADVLLLVLADASVSSEFVSTANADKITGFESDISSAISVDITIDKILNGESSISTVAALASDGARTRDGDSAVAAEFTQSALVGAIRQGEVSVTGAFSPTLVATFLRLGDIDMASNIAISVDAQRTRDPNATTLANIINLSAQGDKLPGGIVAVSITASLTGSLDPLKIAEASVSAIFAAAITGRVVKGFASTLDSVFHQGTQIGDDFTTNVEAIFPLEADLSAATSTSVSGDRFRTTDIDFQSIATQMSVAGFLQSDIANLVSSFAITADVGVIKPGAASISTIATVEVAGGAVRPGASSMETTATQTVEADAINGFEANLFSEFFVGHTTDIGFTADVLPNIVKEFDATLSVDCTLEADSTRIQGTSAEFSITSSIAVTGTKTVEGAADITDAVVFQATVNITKLGEIESTIQINLAATVDRIRTTGSVPTAVSGCVTDPSTIFESSADFELRFTITAAVGLLNISEDRTYMVPREHRLYAVPRENREHTITRENRVYTIKGAA